MDPNIDEQNLPDETEDDNGNDNRDDRPIELPVWADSRWVTIISIFCIGLLSGFGGGFLLGGTSVVLLQSVELLADNRQFMDKLEIYIYIFGAKYLYGIIDKEESFDNIAVVRVNTASFTTIFGVVSSILSVAPGLCIGLSTYSLGIKKHGQAAKGKALSVAGPVCLMVTTATGYLLGHAFESFVSILTLNVNTFLWVFFFSLLAFVLLIIFFVCLYDSGVHISIPSCRFITFLIIFLFKMSSILEAVFTPVFLILKSLKQPHVTLYSLVFIYGAFILADHHIVVFQSTTLNDINMYVLEAVFAGVFISQLWAITMGSLSFVFWQRGGAFKVCAAALASGTAVLSVIKLALPSLGPGPSIGALMGVAGAVGVSLSAAGAATDQYSKAVDHCGLSGQLGVAVGAAVGAFLPTYTHSGLSGLFMSLFTASVSAADFVKMHISSRY